MWPDLDATRLNFGSLISVYLRQLKGVRATELDLGPTFSKSTLDRLLYNTGARPQLYQVDTIADALRLTTQQRTQLYAAADYLPEPHTMREQVASWLQMADTGKVPMHLLDIRGFIWAWNKVWRDWFVLSRREAAAQPEHAHAADGRDRQRLTLEPGVHWLQLLYHPQSPIRQAVETVSHARWEAWAFEEMIDFRRLTRRLIAREGELAWIDDVRARLASLPSPMNREALTHWDQALHREVAPPQVGGRELGQPSGTGHGHMTGSIFGKPPLSTMSPAR